jgi:hypothetical protein
VLPVPLEPELLPVKRLGRVLLQPGPLKPGL